MKNETDTWYVLVDGTHADPAEVITDKDGVMKHKNGVTVALRDSGIPLTSGVATKENKRAHAKAEEDAEETKTRESKADKPKAGTYKTRESKAD